MKKNPGRRERRAWFFRSRREFGRKRSRLHSHYYHQLAVKAKPNNKGEVANGNSEEIRNEEV